MIINWTSFQFERGQNFPFDWPASVSNILTVRGWTEPEIVGRNQSNTPNVWWSLDSLLSASRSPLSGCCTSSKCCVMYCPMAPTCCGARRMTPWARPCISFIAPPPPVFDDRRPILRRTRPSVSHYANVKGACLFVFSSKDSLCHIRKVDFARCSSASSSSFLKLLSPPVLVWFSASHGKWRCFIWIFAIRVSSVLSMLGSPRPGLSYIGQFVREIDVELV